MTEQQHPITPPPELVEQWLEDSPEDDELGIAGYIATQAACWGADQELKACCEWLISHNWRSVEPALRAARRPKPPSLKEQALALINHDPDNQPFLSEEDIAIIRHALNELPDE